jgi:hypothetical protein
MFLDRLESKLMALQSASTLTEADRKPVDTGRTLSAKRRSIKPDECYAAAGNGGCIASNTHALSGFRKLTAPIGGLG